MAQIGDREELRALQRMAELEDKAAGGFPIPGGPQQEATEPGVLERLSTGIQGVTEAATGPFTFGVSGPVSDIGAQAGESLVNFIFEDVFGQKAKKLPRRVTSKERREKFQETSPVAAATASAIGTLANPVTQRLANIAGGGVRATGKAVGRVSGPVSRGAAKFTEGAAKLVEGGVKTAGEFIATDEENRDRAREKVIEALQRDGFSPEEAAARIW